MLFLKTWTCDNPPKNVLVVGTLVQSPKPKILSYLTCCKFFGFMFNKPVESANPAYDKIEW
jgi:hypothetical protein